jgi:hypothetical protein
VTDRAVETVAGELRKRLVYFGIKRRETKQRQTTMTRAGF